MYAYYREKHGSFGTRQDSHIFESSLKARLFQDFQCCTSEKLCFVDNFGVDIPPYTCEFCSVADWSNMCLVADEDGHTTIINTSGYSSKVCQKWQCHKNAIFDVTWVPHSRTFATASGDTTAVLWDATVPQKEVNRFKGHSCSLKSICVSKHNPYILATGARDGNAIIWDSRCNGRPAMWIRDAHAVNDALTPQRKRRRRSFASINNPPLHDSRHTVTSTVFHDEITLITSGAMDGTIKLWDIRTGLSARSGISSRSSSANTKKSIAYPGMSNRRRGYTCLILDSTHSRLFASCTDNSVYEYNLSKVLVDSTSQPERRYTGHHSSSFYIKMVLSPDDLFLLSGSNDDKAFIWNTVTLLGEVFPSYSLVSDGMEQVTSVGWCPSDWSKVVTCSDDCAVRVWRIPPSMKRQKYDVDGQCVPMQTPSSPADQLLQSPHLESGLEARKDIGKPPQMDKESPNHVKYLNRKQSSLKKWLVEPSTCRRKSGMLKSRAVKRLDEKLNKSKVLNDKENEPQVHSDGDPGQKNGNSPVPIKCDLFKQNVFPMKRKVIPTKTAAHDKQNRRQNSMLEDYFRSFQP